MTTMFMCVWTGTEQRIKNSHIEPGESLPATPAHGEEGRCHCIVDSTSMMQLHACTDWCLTGAPSQRQGWHNRAKRHACLLTFSLPMVAGF